MNGSIAPQQVIEGIAFHPLPGDRHTRFRKHAQCVGRVVELALTAIAIENEILGDIGQRDPVEF